MEKGSGKNYLLVMILNLLPIPFKRSGFVSGAFTEGSYTTHQIKNSRFISTFGGGALIF